MIRLRSECIQCLIKSNLNKCPEGTPEEVKREYMQRFLKILAEAPKEHSAPVVTVAINALQKELLGIEAREYSAVKKHFNEVMLGYEAEVWERISQAEDKLKLAMQYAMVGNYIDFGAMEHVDENYLSELLHSAHEKEMSESQYQNLKKDMEIGKKLVYLTDNCGEVVMDKLLIKVIQERYPHLDITLMVRGGDVLNDATMEDAKQVGLTDVVKVMGNGNSIAGTCLEELSEEAFLEIESADLILAKGQANYETMRGCGKNIYHLFLCKCAMFANTFGVPRMTGMLINETK